MVFNIRDNGELRSIDVPQEAIERYRKAGIPLREMGELYASDEGIIENQVVSELTAKAKANKSNKRATYKANRKAPSRKPNPIRRSMIAELEKFISEHAENVSVDNPERIISFTLGSDTYTLTLSKKRK